MHTSVCACVCVCVSAKQLEQRQKKTAKKRRLNQNDEIKELGALLPSVASLTSPELDKISVLRLATTYLKLQNFIKSGVSVCTYVYVICTRNRAITLPLTTVMCHCLFWGK